ncbi:MAG: serine O-acetyltransferase [Alphaproteobacteria bacterium]|nr:serine O-acetyltransferase [Alphaproteobacteria bacterium]MBQ2811014.1 serine O-acetyltransferase [Alphaproteobacteria bacterium]
MKTKNKSLIFDDLQAVVLRDPATASKFQAAVFSSGFHAICLHRLNHWLWNKGFKFVAKLSALIARFFTGIEIHPNAKIGKGFFIDHGMGVVIGETAEIGDNVTLYHDVTLGGTTVFGKNGKVMSKRHPTIGNNVIIGSGAQVLGPINIGDNVKIGSNAVVVKDVAANLTVVGVPAHSTESKTNKKKTFCAYGMDKNLSDPVDEDIKKLQIQLKHLQEELEHLKNKL